MTPLRLMCYNIRVNHDQDQLNENIWSERKDKVVSVIKHEHPDILAIQEPNADQLDDLKQALGPAFQWVAVRASERAYDPTFREKEPNKYKSEQSREMHAIAFNIDKMELVADGRFWLADDPTKEPDEPAWGGSKYARVAVWATLRDKTTQKLKTIITAHSDFYPESGMEAQQKSAHLLVKKAEDITEKKHPFILCGDFNTFQEKDGEKTVPGKVYDAFMSHSDAIEDVRAIAKEIVGVNATWVGWDYNENDQKKLEEKHKFDKDSSRWDQIFFSKGHFAIERTEVIDKTFDIIWKKKPKTVYPSDHRPLTADFTIL